MTGKKTANLMMLRMEDGEGKDEEVVCKSLE